MVYHGNWRSAQGYVLSWSGAYIGWSKAFVLELLRCRLRAQENKCKSLRFELFRYTGRWRCSAWYNRGLLSCGSVTACGRWRHIIWKDCSDEWSYVWELRRQFYNAAYWYTLRVLVQRRTFSIWLGRYVRAMSVYEPKRLHWSVMLCLRSFATTLQRSLHAHSLFHSMQAHDWAQRRNDLEDDSDA